MISVYKDVESKEKCERSRLKSSNLFPNFSFKSEIRVMYLLKSLISDLAGNVGRLISSFECSYCSQSPSFISDADMCSYILFINRSFPCTRLFTLFRWPVILTKIAISQTHCGSSNSGKFFDLLSKNNLICVSNRTLFTKYEHG